MVPGEYDPNLGEVARRLDEVFRRYESIANDLPKTFVSRDLFESYKDLAKTQADGLQILIGTQEKRIADLEDDKKWLYRLVIGAVIMALLGVVLGLAGGNPTKNSGLSSPSVTVVSTQ